LGYLISHNSSASVGAEEEEEFPTITNTNIAAVRPSEVGAVRCHSEDGNYVTYSLFFFCQPSLSQY